MVRIAVVKVKKISLRRLQFQGKFGNINVFHSQDKYASVEDISDALRSNDFDMKIVLKVLDDTKQRENVTF